jgi:hypothetical protein
VISKKKKGTKTMKQTELVKCQLVALNAIIRVKTKKNDASERNDEVPIQIEAALSYLTTEPLKTRGCKNWATAATNGNEERILSHHKKGIPGFQDSSKSRRISAFQLVCHYYCCKDRQKLSERIWKKELRFTSLHDKPPLCLICEGNHHV